MRKITSLFLSITMIASSIPGGGGLFRSSNAETKIYPQDTVVLKKISDGTHDVEGKKTFINSENGFYPGDNTPTDGVVTSNDYVTYEYKLNITAGPARTIKVKFSQEGDGLDLQDIKNLNLENSIIESSYNKEEKSWNYKIPKGATAQLKTLVEIKAKDTKGEISTNNIIKAELTNNDYKFVNKSQPVTVVSIPFADLTLRGEKVNHQYEKAGGLIIRPDYLGVEGYSYNGLTNRTMWHTDLDVSDFPNDTLWYLNDKEIKPENGIIKDLKGINAQHIKYILPEKAKPSETDKETRQYTAHIIPYKDSFKTKDFYNIPDIGLNQDENYNTSTFELNGEKIKATEGDGYPNNNYVKEKWVWVEPIKDHNIKAESFIETPYNGKFTIFEKPNIYFDTNRNWWDDTTKGNTLVPGSEAYAMTWVDLSHLDDENMKDADNLTILSTINSNVANKDYLAMDFDNQRSVVVKAGRKIISPDLYTVSWGEIPKNKLDPKNMIEADKWIESNKVPNSKVNQCKITFKKNAFKTEDMIRTYIPLKIPESYNKPENRDKRVSLETKTYINDKQSKRSRSYKKLNFPKVPKLTTEIKPYKLESDIDNISRTHHCRFEIKSALEDPILSKGYSIKRILTFDKAYDINTFVAYDSLNYIITKTGDHEITIETKKPESIQKVNDKWCLHPLDFEIQSIFGINELKIDAPIKEKTIINYKGLDDISDGSVSSDSSTKCTLKGSKITSLLVRSLSKHKEIDDELSYKVEINTDTKAFKQKIILPYNGDFKEQIPKINKANNSNIDIDEETGLDKSKTMEGIGRSKISGEYNMKSLKLNTFSKNTKIKFHANGQDYNLPVRANGNVDVSAIKNISLGNIKDSRIEIIAPERPSDIQGIGSSLVINIKPTNNKIGDAYVIWLDELKSYDNDEIINEKLTWPDYTTIVASSIEGQIYNDENQNAKIDKNEDGYKGVTVKLQKQDVNGDYMDTGLEQLTGETGFYKFDNLKHGKYRIVLKNVKRKVGQTDEIESINKSTNENAKDGELPLGKTNRFGVFEKTKQTHSYNNKKGNLSDNKAEIDLDYNESIKKINFGFFIPKSDLALDKSKATITENKDTAKISWDITIKNNSNDYLKNIELTDVTDKKLKNVKASLGYYDTRSKKLMKVEKIKDNIIMTTKGYFFAQGDRIAELKGISGELIKYDSLIITSDGIYKNKLTAEDWKEMYKDPTCGIDSFECNGKYLFDYEKIKEIEGKYVSLLNGPGRTVIATDKGVYEINPFNLTIRKIENLQGDILKLIGNPERYIVVTDKAYYFVDDNEIDKHGMEGIVKLKNIDGKFITNNYNVIVTTKGCYIFNRYGDKDTAIKKINDIDEDIKTIIGISDENLGIATQKKYYLFKNHKIITANNITGDIKIVEGKYPASSGAIIATSDGLWFVDKNGEAKKINGITGDIKAIKDNSSENKGGGVVVTSDGIWIIDDKGEADKIEKIKDTIKIINLPYIATSENCYKLDKQNNVTKIEGIEGSIINIETERIHTTKGVYDLDRDGNIEKGKYLNFFKTQEDEQPIDIAGDFPIRSKESVVTTTDGCYIMNKDDKPTKIKNITEDIRLIAGNNPKWGLILATKDNYYLVNKDVATKVNNITGDIKTITGDDPLTPINGSAVATTDGVWTVNNKAEAKKINNITGDIKIITGSKPLNPEGGLAVATAKDVWIINNNNEAKKISGITGDIRTITGDMPTTNGISVATTDGIWIIEKSGKAEKLKNITGDVKIIKGSEPNLNGLAIATTDGYYIVDNNNRVTKIDEITGDIKSIIGKAPSNKNGGSVVATTDGIWLVNKNGETRKVNNITGNIKAMTGTWPNEPNKGFAVATNNGYYLVNNQGIATKVKGINEDIKYITGVFPLHPNGGSAVATVNGCYIVDEKGNAKKVKNWKKDSIEKTYISDQNIVEDSIESKDGFNIRKYTLPEIAPNDTITVSIEGFVNKTSKDQIIASQSYATSEKTPRHGIKTSNPTGANMPDGVPSLPTTPSISIYDPEGIRGNTSAMINLDIDTDEAPADDLADQTPALIPMVSPNDPLYKYLNSNDGTIGGIAFYDLNKNGLNDDNAPSEGIKVTITDENGLTYSETKTDNQGKWEASNLPSHKKYQVHYNISEHKHENKTWTTTKLNISGENKENDNDTLENGYVSELIDVNSHHRADCGLIAIDADISIIKGYKAKNKDDIDIIYGNKTLSDKTSEFKFDINPSNLPSINPQNGRFDDNDYDSTTQGYSFTILNTGSSNLDNIIVNDKTIKGNDANIFDKLYYYKEGEKPKEINLKNKTLYDGEVPLIMEAGTKVIGYLGLEFNKNNQEHEDKIEVSSRILNEKNTPIGSLNSQDTLRVKYEYRANKTLNISKYGVQSIDDKDKKTLSNVSFKIYSVEGNDDKPDYKSLGTYVTDEKGNLNINLPEGTYRLVEKNTKIGYRKPPEDGWFIKIKYNEDGTSSISIKASSEMPYSTISKQSDDKNWGTVDIYNYSLIKIPTTGGAMIYTTMVGISLIAAGFAVFSRKTKEQI